jgi:hypothetical protein
VIPFTQIWIFVENHGWPLLPIDVSKKRFENLEDDMENGEVL